MTFIPLLVFGALAILLIVLFRRTRTARNRSSTYDGDTWTPMTWTDGNADSPCDSSGTADCRGADASCDGGGGGGD
jgi:hypothetical protein